MTRPVTHGIARESRWHWKPIVLLIVFAPGLAEIISSAMPVTQFFLPQVFFPFVIFLYGLPVLLIREFAVRTGTGPLGLWCLGTVYAIYNEALHSETVFQPFDIAVEAYAEYGILADLRVPWTLWILVWHGVFSVVIPILLVEWLFPRSAGKPWLPGWTLTVPIILCAASTIWYFLYDSDESRTLPGAVLYGRFVALVVVSAVLWLAGWWLGRRTRLSDGAPTRRWRPFALGFALYVPVFLVPNLMAEFGLPWLVFVAYFVVVVAATLVLLARRPEVTRSAATLLGLGLGTAQGALGIGFGTFLGNPLWALSSAVFVVGFVIVALRIARGRLAHATEPG